MEYSAIQVLLVFIVGFICGIDQFSFLESLYQPIVTGAVIGLILGDVQTGLIIGGTYQLMTIGNMPVGGAQPPNAVIGGIMATVLGISMHVDANTAVGLAIPFSLLGQYGVTLIFTIMSPVMAKADACAHNADVKGIERINILAMVALGLIFGLICALFFVGGATFGQTLASAIPTWLMTGPLCGWWHDALRRLRHPAQGHGFRRALGLLLHGLRGRQHRYRKRDPLQPGADHPCPHRLWHRVLGLSDSDQVQDGRACACR